MDVIYNELWKLVALVISALVGAAVTYGIKLLKKKGIELDKVLKNEIVQDAVKFVEQVAKDLNLDSKGKLEKAEEVVVSVLTSKGIKITEDELQMLIESAVKAMNDTIKSVK